MGEELVIMYENAAPLRTSPCLAWLIEYQAGGRDILMTSPSMDVKEVVHMVSMRTHDNFTVANITVGAWPVMSRDEYQRAMKENPHIEDWFQSYFGDARKISESLEVIV